MPYFIEWSHIQALYEHEMGTPAARFAKYVKDWFQEKATDAGWHATVPMKNARDNHGAGFVVWIDTPIDPTTKPKPAAPKPAATKPVTPKPATSKPATPKPMFALKLTLVNYGSQADDDDDD